jgi:FKBP-type peptidyl-prolyl cis-trans isomerase FklB
MKKWVLAAMCAALVACNNSENGSNNVIQDAKAAEKGATALKTEDQKASYAIGLRYGEGFARDLKEIDLTVFFKGLEDGFKGNPPQMTPEEIVATLQALQSRKMEEQQQEQAKASEGNKSASEEFLAKNKERKEVTTTESGLQYEVIKKGDGATPAADDKVNVHYHGTLPDGTVFDSSVERGEPISFAVNGVIKGWTEALQMMKVGDKWKLYIPADLAYGPRGAGPKIGPHQALVFDVELLGVEKAN